MDNNMMANVIGTAGNDKLVGKGVFQGGAGDDNIYAWGNNSSDTFLFNLGDGKDSISSYDSAYDGIFAADKIVFGADVNPDMIGFLRSGNNLIIIVGDKGDQITLTDYFARLSSQTVNRFEFADGTVWEDIRQQTFKQFGTSGSDVLLGTDFDDEIYGGDGDDLITDTKGNNYLDGGAGNDTLVGRGTFHGGTGDDIINAWENDSADTFLFNLGDGKDYISNRDQYGREDKIVFGSDVTAGMIAFYRDGNNMIITVGNNGDQITLEDYFRDEYFQTVRRFEFADGTVWKDIRQTSQFDTMLNIVRGDDKGNLLGGTFKNDYIIGGAGNDTLFGGSGDDVLEGGIGNDTLHGGNGRDTYLFKQGDGQDIIVTGEDGLDIIKFNQINFEMLKNVNKIGNDLTFSYSDNDKITVKNYFDGGSFGSIEFTDKTITKKEFDELFAAAFEGSNPVANQVNNLISAMSTFAPQGGISSLLPDNYQHSANTLLAPSVA